ncbi:MAG: hypothetical protein H6632_18155 [Anaerolineales bacterium]|nr:hypothetical protein [Anaerolineales bacterium]
MFIDITPKAITFRTPNHLSPGLYKREVRAKYGQSGLRTGINGRELSLRGQLHSLISAEKLL